MQTDSIAKVIVWCPFGVYIQYTKGQRKLVALCPEEGMRDVVAEALAVRYQVEIEVRNQ